jgi:hypothetical protein
MQTKYLIISCLSVFIYLFIYTFLHEMGHGIIGVLSGGNINKLILGFNARINIRNTNYNSITLPLMNVMGMLLPYVVFLILSLNYKKDQSNILYKVGHGIYVFGILASLLPWVIIPLISIFTTPPRGDDVTNFIQNSGLQPMFISLLGIILFALFLYLSIQKDIIRNFMGIIKKLKENQ